MRIDFVPMKLVPGSEVIPMKIGQVIEVFLETPGNNDLKVPMTVIKTYENGDFDGEVEWEEA